MEYKDSLEIKIAIEKSIRAGVEDFKKQIGTSMNHYSPDVVNEILKDIKEGERE